MKNTVPLFAVMISLVLAVASIPFCCADAQALSAAPVVHNLTIASHLRSLGMSMTDANVLFVSYHNSSNGPITTLAYDVATNRILWVAPIPTTDGSFVVTPTLIVTVAAWPPKILVAQDVKSGKIVWNVTIPYFGRGVRGAARIDETVTPVIYVVSNSQTDVYCYREIDGKLLWHSEVTQDVSMAIKADPMLALDGLFLFGKNQAVYLDGTGKIQTVKTFEGDIVSTEFVAMSDFRFLVQSDKSFVVYDASANFSVVGHIQKEIKLGNYKGYMEFVPSDPRLALIYTCINFTMCHFLKYDVVDDKAIWNQSITVKSNTPVYFLPVTIGKDGKLYLKDLSANSDGDIIVLDPESGKSIGRLPGQQQDAVVFAVTETGVAILSRVLVSSSPTIIYFESL